MLMPGAVRDAAFVVGFGSRGLTVDDGGPFRRGDDCGCGSEELFPMGGNPAVGGIFPGDGGTDAGGDGGVEDGVPVVGVVEDSGPPKGA